jgi:hypothetical protein
MVPEESFSPLRTSPRSDREQAAPCSLKSLVLRGEPRVFGGGETFGFKRRPFGGSPFHPPARCEEILGQDVDDLDLDAKSAMTHDVLARSLRDPRTGPGGGATPARTANDP